MAKGKCTDYVCANPHGFVKLDAKDDSGNLVHWIIEGQNPLSMTQMGWSKNPFKPGDEVEIDAMSSKKSNPVGYWEVLAKPPRKGVSCNQF